MFREVFIRDAMSAALRVESASFNPVIAVAQAALESNWGRSELAVKANNLKGVKAGSSWSGEVIELPTKEWRSADNDFYVTMARWRVYEDWVAAFRDYGDLIERVYPFAVEFADDPLSFLEALVERDYPRYATDPDYVAKVWDVVMEFSELFDELLSEDKGLLLVFGAGGDEVFRMSIPSGGDVVTRSRVRSSGVVRYYVKVE